jgi:hypothetical protein
VRALTCLTVPTGGSAGRRWQLRRPPRGDRGRLRVAPNRQKARSQSVCFKEAARLQVDSLEQEEVKPSTLVAIYALGNRIRLNSSQEVVEAAENTVREIIKSYRRPKMTAEEIRRQAYLEIEDPVKEFGEPCRRELKRLYREIS